MKTTILALALGLATATVLDQHTGRQAYRVKGKFMCGDDPAGNIKVKLVDIDTSIDPDDVMAEGHTDSTGAFDLQGDTMEGTTIDPFLKVYHDCNDGMTPCQRRWKFELPNKYISGGAVADHKKVIDIGTWNLEMIMPEEEHDCIH